MGRNMFRAFLALSVASVALMLSSPADADTYVRGYYRGGKYVHPHYRSDRNGTVRDNWTTKGNRNPHTGKLGTRTYRGR